MNTYKCKCGNQANFVAEIDMFDKYEQFHCDKCHCTFVVRNGRYLREGILPEPFIYDNVPSGLYDYDDY